MESNVKFVSYTGEYPNLCSGILTLEIYGIQYTFGRSYKKPKPDFDCFWSSGGCIMANENDDYDVMHDEWTIHKKDIPAMFKEYADEIGKVFNENVRCGCCGGCI